MKDFNHQEVAREIKKVSAAALPRVWLTTPVVGASYAERVIASAWNISETSEFDWWFPCVIQVANKEAYTTNSGYHPSLSLEGRLETKQYARDENVKLC